MNVDKGQQIRFFSKEKFRNYFITKGDLVTSDGRTINTSQREFSKLFHHQKVILLLPMEEQQILLKEKVQNHFITKGDLVTSNGRTINTSQGEF